jgi:hypothetical protein
MIAPVVIDVAPAVVSDRSQQGVVQQLISRRAPCPLTLTIDAHEPFDVVAIGAHPMIWRLSLAARWQP